MSAFTRFRVLVTLVVAAAVVACAGAASPASAAEKGVVTDMTWGIGEADQDRTAAIVEDSGAQWVRLNISWYWYDLYPVEMQAQYDRAVDLARAAGAKVILMVNHAPARHSGSANLDAPPKDPAAYADFLREFVPKFADRVDAWEIWNEPNHPEFWPTLGGPDAAEYVKLLKAGSQAVRATDPTAPVLFAGLAFNDYTFLERAYAADPQVGDYFDVMALHPYTGPFSAAPEQISRAADGRMTTTSFPAYREVRQVMRSHGDTRPIWFTEFGWSSNSVPLMGVSEATQADYLTRAYEYIEQDAYVEVAVIYSLRNSYWAADANNWLDQLGLLRVDFSPKPAYEAFKSYAPPRAADPQPQPAPGPAAAPPPATQPAAPAAPQTLPVRELPATAGPASAAPAMTLRIQRTSSRTSRSRTGRRTTRVRAIGSVRNARGGHVRLRVQRRASNGAWKQVQTTRARLNSKGRFSASVKPRSSGRFRVLARYVGTHGAISSSAVFAVGRR